MKEIFGAGLIAILIIVVVFTLSFLVIAGMYWIVCWAFGMVFSWQIAVGVWVVYTVLSSMFQSVSK